MHNIFSGLLLLTARFEAPSSLQLELRGAELHVRIARSEPSSDRLDALPVERLQLRTDRSIDVSDVVLCDWLLEEESNILWHEASRFSCIGAAHPLQDEGYSLLMSQRESLENDARRRALTISDSWRPTSSRTVALPRDSSRVEMLVGALNQLALRAAHVVQLSWLTWK